jgi:hypothetical protein
MTRETKITTKITTPLRLISDDQPTADALAARLAIAPGLVRPGASRWSDGRTPVHPLSLENAYADPDLLRDLGARGARFARDLGVDVVVGAETAGVPLAASVALAGGLLGPPAAGGVTQPDGLSGGLQRPAAIEDQGDHPTPLRQRQRRGHSRP